MPIDLLKTGLPSDPDTEKLILGAAMTDPEALPSIAASLAPEDFAVEAHRRTVEAVLAVYGRGETVQRNTVFYELERRGFAKGVGGLSFLTELDDGLPKLYSVEDYILRVKDKATLRRAAIVHERCLEQILGGRVTGIEAMESINALSRSFGDSASHANRLPSVGEIFAEVGVEAILNPASSPDQRSAVRLPWRGLDELLGGLRPGQLVILGARPAVGKTAMALSITLAAAMNKRPAALFSLEMPSSELLQRATCSLARVDSVRARHGGLDQNERAQLMTQATAIEALPFFLDDQTGATVAGVTAAVRARHDREKLALVVVDYLQLMTGGGRFENRNVEVSAISRGLKRLAREMRIPVLALCQLTREPERANRAPSLADLRDSGSLEQDADAVILLHAGRDQAGPTIEVSAHVAKNRNGPVGKVMLHFERRYTRFVEVTDGG
jgi:replicative DNA helicase